VGLLFIGQPDKLFLLANNRIIPPVKWHSIRFPLGGVPIGFIMSG
jgi:hypothetical protein